MIPYLSDFWSLADSTGQNIGNAVAGALGNIFLYPLHLLVDFVLTTDYLLEQLLQIISVLFTPLIYIFGFLNGIIVALASPPTVTAPFVPLSSALTLISALPGMTALLAIMTGCIWLLTLKSVFVSTRHV